MKMVFQRGNWMFTDEFGQVWRLTPSGDESMPLIISLEDKGSPPQPVTPQRPRHTGDDIGFDEQGRPIAVGAEAGAGSDAIIDHPDARPVLIVARLGTHVGVRVFGPPAAETAQLLDELAATYRKAVEASRQPSQ